MSADVVTWSDQIAAAVSEDTRLPYPVVEHETAIANLQDFFTERAERRL